MNIRPEKGEYDLQEDLTIFWKACCFLLPIAGIIVYFFQKKKENMLKAKSALIAAVAGMILNILSFAMDQYFTS